MRKDIHPAYQQVLFHDTNADVYFLIGSTIRKHPANTALPSDPISLNLVPT